MTDAALRLFERARQMLADLELRAFDREAAPRARWRVSTDVFDEMTAVAAAWSDGEYVEGRTTLFGYDLEADPEMPPRSITIRGFAGR
jgi:hypothetical protein